MRRSATTPPIVLLLCLLLASCTEYVGEELREGATPGGVTALRQAEVPQPPRPALPVDPHRLEVGSCFDDLDAEPLQAFPRGEEVGLVPCDQPHRFELFALVELEAGERPPTAELEDLTDRRCGAAFEEYVGTPWASSSLDYLVLVPDESRWAEGVHHASCALYDLMLAPVSGSMAGSGR